MFAAAWFVALIAQSSLVTAGRVDLHRRSGVISVGLAAAVILTGIAAAVIAARRPGGFIDIEAPPPVYEEPAPDYGGWYIRGDLDYHASRFRGADYIVYGPPPGTNAFEWTGALAEPARFAAEGGRSMPASRRQPKRDIEVQIRKPTGHSGH